MGLRGKKKKAAGSELERTSASTTLCSNCSKAENSLIKMQLEFGGVVTHNAPSGYLPLEVIEDEAAEKDPRIKEYLRQRKVRELKELLALIEAGEGK